MLLQFSSIREQIENAVSDETRQITGHILVTPTNLTMLQALQNKGHVITALDGSKVVNFEEITVSASTPLRIRITLDPKSLSFYEGMSDLVKIQNQSEPEDYFVFGIGHVWRKLPSDNKQIGLYRDVLRARKIIEVASDHLTGDKAFIVTSKKLVLRLIWKPEAMRSIACLSKLEAELAEGAVERDQRLALLRRAIQQALGEIPEEERFTHFLSTSDSIYEVYRRDYLLWIGETFSELEKSFEEKRLKFIGDINGVLSSIQASILALPIAGLLVADKFDAATPLKDLALAAGMSGVAYFAWKLLDNQQHALDAISTAIISIQQDFAKKQPQKKEEAAARLKAVTDQRERVKDLIANLRTAVITIVVLTWGAMFWAALPFLCHRQEVTNAGGVDAKKHSILAAPQKDITEPATTTNNTTLKP